MADSTPGTVTRGGQPLEDPPDPADVEAAERVHEAELGEERQQIGTTRGGQPIESVTHPEPDDDGDEPSIGTTRGDQPVQP